jgi:predicted ATP-dependent endonuclease of OLD family
MQTQLIKYRVQNFRSIIDSGWIDIFENTCMIGTNESGKTNLLVGLWKLNPANNEDINPLIDYPRKKFVDYAKTNGEDVFVSAYYTFNEPSKNLVKSLFRKEVPLTIPEVQPQKEVSEGTEEPEKPIAMAETVEFLNTDEVSEMLISRKFNGNYVFEFPKIFPENVSQINVTAEIQEQILKAIPKFVYYSDYGNLDSEIYLPHVIANFKRTDLGERERLKVRSLKVLFEFVQLSPDDILRLGKEKKETQVKVYQHDPNTIIERKKIEPTQAEIEKESEQKKEREILLQSASTKLTGAFKEWWKQGNYRFRFQADGNHFRIWVSDELRPEEVELEGRSKGLQWFFSFFLVFLVESKDTHSNCILLLDEPGLSLHPVAQFDLIKFFNSLANENQIIYTTHSPFLVNPDNLANVKAVFVDDNGTSSVSSDLRRNSSVAQKSIYPVHAAIGLTISDTLLLGCQPVLVEGQSDQIYLQIIKNHLSGLGNYQNAKEMVFIPTGGVRGMSAVISIVSARENDLPFAIVDSDKPGKEKADKLRNDVYKLQPERIIEVENILTIGEFEVEDFLPKEELAKIFSKRYRGLADDFEYVLTNTEPIIQQMEKFAKENGHKLELGWKVELAMDFHNQFQHIAKRVSADTVTLWTNLFDKLTKK